MKSALLGIILFFIPFLGTTQWINEIHYDNNGADVNECIEVAGPAGTDLSGWSIVLYNGPTPYDTDALSGIIPDEGCGYGAISLCYPANGIQNGGADGIVLYDGSSVVQFFSYEGVINATSGVANGMTSTDIGVAEGGSTVGSSLQLTGSGTTYSDFTWQSEGPAASMGSLNAGQSITPCGSNLITTGAITGGPFTVNCVTPTTDNGTVAFTSTGTFNAGNTFTVQMSDASGNFASPNNVGTLTGAGAEGVDPSGTINITIPSGTLSGAGYLFQVVADDPATTGSASGVFTITQTGGGACLPESITTGAVTGGPFTVDCAVPTTDNGTVAFTTTGVYAAGNTFTVQMSDASGSFAFPTNVGILSGAGAEGATPSGSINITIPSGTASGAGYLFRVVSDNPVTTGSNSSSVTITQTGSCVLEPPHMTSVIINSCNAICNEGVNEMVFGTSGDYSIDVTAANFNFSYTNTPPITASNNFTDILTNNTPTTNELNNQCATTDPFIDANGTTIPPNSSWVLLNNDICVADALDWSGLCNSGPIYVIYSSDPTWLAGGNFSNTTNGIRPYQTSITTTSGQTCTIDYETDGSQYADSDGVFASFDANGGAAIAYGDDDCMLQPIVLPIELYSFEGEIQNQASLLNWTTITEYNFSHFNIYHATDVTSFYKIGSVAAAGNTELKQDYRMTHPNPVPGINYYRLSAVDNNGSERNHGMLALRMDIHFAYFNGNSIVLDAPYSVEVYNLHGQLIAQSNDEIEIPFNQKGMFLIREIESGTTQKIVIQ